MYKGFYNEYFTMKQEVIDGYLDLYNETFSFEFLENTNEVFHQDELMTIDLFKYLHGFCDEFALMLNTVFNYPIEVIFKCGNIIHAYCKVDNLYIDVRGITDDKELFFQEFKEDLLYETHRCSYKTAKECFYGIKDWYGENYHIVQKNELELLANDKWLNNYYKI